MAENLDLSTLASRPSWRVVKIFKWMAIVSITLFIVFEILSMVLLYIDEIALNGASETDDTVFILLGDFAAELAVTVIMFAIYALFLWLFALAVDKLDQLVWLNASEEDRLHIYNQRQKKK